MPGGQILGDHPAKGLRHDDVDAPAELLGDQPRVVVRHVGDGVLRRHAPAPGDNPDGVSGVKKGIELPPEHPAQHPLGNRAARARPG